MRWTTQGAAAAFGLFLLAANIQPVAAQQSSENSVNKHPVHEERDPVTNAVFRSTVDAQGNAVFTVNVEDFTLEKAVASSGDTTIRLTQGKDNVSIGMNRGGYVVSRGRKTARLDPQSGKPEDMDAVRGLLLGSQAVRTFRRLSDSLENRDEKDEEGPLFLSTLVDGAIVEMLDGDSGAAQRIGKRITRKHRAVLQQVKLRPYGAFTDCILDYELSLLEAMDLFYECTSSAVRLSWILWWGMETMCELEWFIRSQQYIYQFMSCFAWPF
jgi:hypothetical protein